MRQLKSGQIHFYFGITSILIIVIAGTLMELTSIAEGILGILFVLIMAPVIYLWISKTKKHDHGYSDRNFRHWNRKHDHSS